MKLLFDIIVQLRWEGTFVKVRRTYFC